MQTFHPPRPHSRPPRPAQGYLVQKIIACEKRTLPCLNTEWCFDSCCATSVQSVSAAGAPRWTLENGCTLRVSLPLNVRLCDACGRCCTQAAFIETETDLPHHFLSCMDDPRSTLLLLPCVRLVRADCTCSGCFRVQLHVSLEICLLRYEIRPCGSCKPECPQLPLYPPPLC